MWILSEVKIRKNLNLLLSMFLFWNSGGVCCPGFQSQGGFAQLGIHLYCDICRLLAWQCDFQRIIKLEAGISSVLHLIISTATKRLQNCFKPFRNAKIIFVHRSIFSEGTKWNSFMIRCWTYGCGEKLIFWWNVWEGWLGKSEQSIFFQSYLEKHSHLQKFVIKSFLFLSVDSKIGALWNISEIGHEPYIYSEEACLG